MTETNFSEKHLLLYLSSHTYLPCSATSIWKVFDYLRCHDRHLLGLLSGVEGYDFCGICRKMLSKHALHKCLSVRVGESVLPHLYLARKHRSFLGFTFSSWIDWKNVLFDGGVFPLRGNKNHSETVALGSSRHLTTPLKTTFFWLFLPQRKRNESKSWHFR